MSKARNKTGLDLISEVQSKMVDMASTKGIDLAEEFGTPGEFNQFVIAYTLKTLRKLGRTSEEAWDIVFGKGSYQDLFESMLA